MARCIFVDASNDLSLRDLPQKYHPENGQALLNVEYSGINPADLAHPKFLGLNNIVAGYEMCGTVVEAGPTSRYKVGDVIFGSNNPVRGKPIYHGAHQDFAILESNTMSAELPAHVPHSHAAGLSIMVRTAGDALLNQFDLPFPAISIDGSPATGGILIWGGGSAVGSAAIQLAKAMGISPIFTTASAINHKALLALGATQCFAYQDPDCVNNIRKATQTFGEIRYILDTVCKPASPGGSATYDQCESIASGPDVLFATCLPLGEKPHWKMVFASRAVALPVPGLKNDIGNPAWESRLEKIMSWAAANYGKQFRIPNVKIVDGGGAGLTAIQDAFAGKNSFEKVVIKHPI